MVTRRLAVALLLVLFIPGRPLRSPEAHPPLLAAGSQATATVVLRAGSLKPRGQGPDSRSLKLDGLFYETAAGRTPLPAELTAAPGSTGNQRLKGQARMSDGRTVMLSVVPEGATFIIRLGARLALGDLEREYRESVAAAQKKPDLKALDAEARTWFEKRTSKRPPAEVARRLPGLAER